MAHRSLGVPGQPGPPPVRRMAHTRPHTCMEGPLKEQLWSNMCLLRNEGGLLDYRQLGSLHRQSVALSPPMRSPVAVYQQRPCPMPLGATARAPLQPRLGPLRIFNRPRAARIGPLSANSTDEGTARSNGREEAPSGEMELLRDGPRLSQEPQEVASVVSSLKTCVDVDSSSKGARIRRQLEQETLARGYLNLSGSCTVLHCAYLRKQQEPPDQEGLSALTESLLSLFTEARGDEARWQSPENDSSVARGAVAAQFEDIFSDLFTNEGDTSFKACKQDLAHFLHFVNNISPTTVTYEQQKSALAYDDDDTGPLPSDSESLTQTNGSSSSDQEPDDSATAAGAEARLGKGGVLTSDLQCKDFEAVVPMQSGSPLSIARRLNPDVQAEEDHDERLRVRFQQYLEFSTYSIVIEHQQGFARSVVQDDGKDGSSAALPSDNLFEISTDDILKALPASWLLTLPGHVFLLANTTIVPHSQLQRLAKAQGHLDVIDFLASRSLQPQGLLGACTPSKSNFMEIYTDYALEPEHGSVSFTFVYDDEDGTRPLSGAEGRMVQRFLELEQYRLLSLMPLPDAKTLQRELLTVERCLNDAIANAYLASRYDPSLRQSSRFRRIAAETLLQQLFALSAQCEEIGCVARNRLSAAAAYGDVAFGRLDRMGLSQKQGTRALSNVLVRRMSPALRTYDSVARKLESTISAVTRTTALLNTQVSIEIERQQELLVSVGTVLSIVTLTITVVQTLSSLSPVN
mmetsp:Transcript_5417/g.19806  ORF Transcript_5417/g.19806 Transcript_5417/m.19806 type:complete len:745 (+) Transcript_5417:89-2323(+)